MRQSVEKKLLNNEIIRERKGLSRTNKEIALPEYQTYLKMSNIMTMMSYDYQMIHLKIFIAVIEKMQGIIEDSINGKPIFQTLPFQEFATGDTIYFNFLYRELGIETRDYPAARKALMELSSLPVEIDARDPLTGADSWKLTNFMEAFIPKEKYHRSFTIGVKKDVLNAVLSMDKGFTRFMKEIAIVQKKKYSIRLYLLISSWKDKGGFSINLAKFRKWLKIEDKYADYKDLYKRVIRPVYEELHEKADCWFEMAEVYKNSADTQPYKLNFKVIKAKLSKKEEEQLKVQRRCIEGMLSQHFLMKQQQIKEILDLVTLGNCQILTQKMLYLHEYTNEHWKTINSKPDYCYKALMKTIHSLGGTAGEEIKVGLQ